MIDNIKVAGLRNNDYSQFLMNTLAAIKPYDPNALQIADEYADLETVSNEILRLVNGTSANAITAELVALDLRRDNAINGIIAKINSDTYSFDGAVKTQANILLAHVGAFGPSIAQESYQNETNKIMKLLLDWNNRPELAAAVTALGLDAWKKELETANTEFDTRYVARSVGMGLSDLDRVYDKRPAANKLYYELRDMLWANYMVNKKKNPEPFLTAIKALNGVTKSYNDLLARKGYTEGDKTGTPDKPADINTPQA